MIILDTNVVSETMRAVPSPTVMAWLNDQHMASLWLTTIIVAELRFGAVRLPSGKRRDTLLERIEIATTGIFADRIAGFDLAAATAFADHAAAAELKGVRVEFADATIAAIALAKGFSVATRDTGPFQAMGVDTIDPWA